MMMRTVFSLCLLILPISFVSAADKNRSKSELDLATLVRTHGFVNPALVQNADEATVGETIAEASLAPVAMPDDAMPDDLMPHSEGDSDGEGGFVAPIRHQQQQRYSTPQRRSSRGGVFSELMELERRKNAWLKRTFLGR